eukprot:m.104029 g.104029  ORF g.104029 m.104029 type:complete len:203 (+) comp12599_c0_seq1:46-654(+)
MGFSSLGKTMAKRVEKEVEPSAKKKTKASLAQSKTSATKTEKKKNGTKTVSKKKKSGRKSKKNSGGKVAAVAEDDADPTEGVETAASAPAPPPEIEVVSSEDDAEEDDTAPESGSFEEFLRTETEFARKYRETTRLDLKSEYHLYTRSRQGNPAEEIPDMEAYAKQLGKKRGLWTAESMHGQAWYVFWTKKDKKDYKAEQQA